MPRVGVDEALRQPPVAWSAMRSRQSRNVSEPAAGEAKSPMELPAAAPPKGGVDRLLRP